MPSNIAANIARLRAERNLSQRALAEASGVNHTQLAKIEMGVTHHPHLSTLLRIRDALQVSLDELYRPQTPPTNEQPEPTTANHG